MALQGLQDEIGHATAHWFTQGGDADFGDIGTPQNADELISAILKRVRADLTRTRQERDAFGARLGRLQAGGYVQHLLGCPHKHRGDNDAGCTCGLVSLQVPEPSAVARPDSLA